MSIWKSLGMAISSIASGGIHLFNWLSAELFSDAEERRSIAFTISMIAISAKMAKADGIVTDSEIRAFVEIFDYPPEEEKNVFRLFRLAQQDIAGFENYAKRLTELFPDDEETLVDILDGLFHIAEADGIIHQSELDFITRVAEIFQISQKRFDQLKAMHILEADNPYLILGIDSKASDQDVRAKYRQLVKETHPDRMIARGVPEEFVKIAHSRLAAINDAWDRIVAERNL